ncbi:MAG: hypothetical protein H0V54_10640 [Chthoniobacterales bacterium]|nr:hypothetical protein [Chthoniobacterales bacterium]
MSSGLGGWFTDKQRSGGGTLIDIGIHALDSAWYLMGTPRPISVTAAVFQNFSVLGQETGSTTRSHLRMTRIRSNCRCRILGTRSAELPRRSTPRSRRFT